MANYKVPQDVEADDKLIGPFSFRQFVYLIIVALACAMSWGLAQLFIPLFLIPTPIIVFFGALALPLRKDQPMEIFMAAMASFYIKPRKRMWNPDGIESLIEVTVPKTVEFDLTKDISQTDARERFDYLSELVDSKGWSVRGIGAQAADNAMVDNAYMEAQQVVDILDDNTYVSKTLDQKLDQSNALQRQQAIDAMHSPQTVDYFNGGPVAEPVTASEPTIEPVLEPDSYPENIQQKVIQPIPTPETTITTSDNTPSADIIKTVKENDDNVISVASIASNANRINTKQDMNEEVVISLR